MRFDTSGFSDVCIKALPMPRSENDASMMIYESPNIGTISDSAVMTNETSTVRLRPIRFIIMPVGTENMRNQKNTSEGNRLAWALVSPRSFCT